MLNRRVFWYANRKIIRQSIRLASTIEDLSFKPKFSLEQQEKILSVVNYSNSEQLSRFDVSQARLKNLDNWKEKNGIFRTLSDILEVEGLGEKVLERLCNSIILDKQPNVPVTINANSSKNRKQIVFPNFTPDISIRVSNAVGIHIVPTGISWAKLSCNRNELNAWSFHDFSSLPKKLLPSETFNLAINILNQLPVADLYIMEASPNLSPQSNKQPLPTYTQQLELSSMLLALLNTNQKHNPTSNEESKHSDLSFENKVYHLRSNLPARLFRTLVGNERVSATETITTLLENDENFKLPCTPLFVKDQIRDEYYRQRPIHRDLLGQALLLVITFMDLCLYRNVASFAAIAPGRR